MKFSIKLPIAIKIYSLAATILVILMGVAVSNYQQMRRVNQDVLVLANYTAPIKKHIATINIYALEQEVHFERILRLYEIQPLDAAKLAVEIQKFKLLGALVDQELKQAWGLSEQAIDAAYATTAIVKFARLKPLLQILEEDHQDFHDQAFEIVERLKSEQVTAATLLDLELEKREEIFNRRIYSILLDLDQFAAETAQEIERHEQNLLTFNLWLTAIAALTGLTLASVLTLRLINPVKKLVQGAQAVEAGNLDTQVAVQSGDEIETLAQSFNTLLQTMRQKQVLKEAFGQYVDPRIVETLLAQPTDRRGQKQIITVFFSDLAKFSTISEMLTPTHLVSLINQYYTLATVPITETQGVIDKFIGDAIVAFWGPPFVAEMNHAQLACYAALEQLTQLIKLQRLLPEILGIRKGIPKLGVRVGLDTGELLIGNVGADHLQSYTVIGRTVEIAEQLEQANKRYGTRILLTERTRQLAGEAIEVREIDRLPIGEPEALVPVYELLAYSVDLNEPMAELRDCFGRGLQAYREENWVRARSLFETCLKININDGPSRFYLEQISKL